MDPRVQPQVPLLPSCVTLGHFPFVSRPPLFLREVGHAMSSHKDAVSAD